MKYFVIKNDGSDLFKEYVMWLNKTYGSKWRLINFNYYGFDSSKIYNGGTNAYDNIHFFINNPTLLTLQEWKEMFIDDEYFVLPKEWYLKVTKENLEISRKYCDFYNKEALEIGHFVLSKHLIDNTFCFLCTTLALDYQEYKEITTEQFIKYAYNPKFKIQETENKKEIIGYKLIKPEYLEAAFSIAKLQNKTKENLKKLMGDSINRMTIDFFKEAGVLDLWFEPIYKKQFKVKDWLTIVQNVSYLNKTFQVEQEMLENVPNDYTLKHKTFGAYRFPDQIRLATKEEIEKLQEKVYTLGINETFEIIVKNKRAFYGSEDVTETLQQFKDQVTNIYCNATRKIGKYAWSFEDVTVLEVGCIKKRSLMSQWLTIDLT